WVDESCKVGESPKAELISPRVESKDGNQTPSRDGNQSPGQVGNQIRSRDLNSKFKSEFTLQVEMKTKVQVVVEQNSKSGWRAN
ncbi:unnamed protein product, partial [Prunus brigantina]